jgi:hypothetical protein
MLYSRECLYVSVCNAAADRLRLAQPCEEGHSGITAALTHPARNEHGEKSVFEGEWRDDRRSRSGIT